MSKRREEGGARLPDYLGEERDCFEGFSEKSPEDNERAETVLALIPL